MKTYILSTLLLFIGLFAFSQEGFEDSPYSDPHFNLISGSAIKAVPDPFGNDTLNFVYTSASKITFNDTLFIPWLHERFGTIATQDANSVDINGGAIDGTIIGGTTTAAGSFTTVNIGSITGQNSRFQATSFAGSYVNFGNNLTLAGSLGKVFIESDLDLQGNDIEDIGQLNVDNLRLDANTISSTDANGNITIDPNGTGDVIIGNYQIDADATVGVSEDNYVLTYDHSTTSWKPEASSGGGDGEWGGGSELTISSGSVAITGGGYYLIDTESDASTDDLNTITGGDVGDILIIRTANNARDVTVIDVGASCSGDAIRSSGNFIMDSTDDMMMIMYVGGCWQEISRSDNN